MTVLQPIRILYNLGDLIVAIIIRRLHGMNKILQKKEVVTIGLVLSLIVIAMIPVAVADNINPGVFAVNSKPYGLSYAQWTANWWKWAMEIPTPNNPIPYKTGTNCAQQQSGPVWFLAGSNGAPIVRDCVIPLGKALLFGPLNSECSYAEDSTLKTEDQLRSCAVNLDVGGVPHVTVDGVALKSLDNYKIQSPIFNFTFPQNNVFGARPGPSQSVSDGWFIMLQPLSPGNHTVHLYGAVLANPTTGTQSFASDATYHLVVK
jgi:hypothetical protein